MPETPLTKSIHVLVDICHWKPDSTHLCINMAINDGEKKLELPGVPNNGSTLQEYNKVSDWVLFSIIYFHGKIYELNEVL